MDTFAPLGSPTATTHTIGGYRVLRPVPGAVAASRRPVQSQRSPALRSAALLGALAVALCVGALSKSPTVEAPAVEPEAARVAYAHDAPQPSGPTGLPAATLADNGEAGTAGAISTSALGQASPPPAGPAQPTARSAKLAPAGSLPAVELVDEPPPVLVAEAAPEPLELVDPAPVTAFPVAIETRALDKPVAHGTATQGRHTKRAHAGRGRRVRTAAASADPTAMQRVPRWAQQMYETPWQSKAFSYFR